MVADNNARRTPIFTQRPVSKKFSPIFSAELSGRIPLSHAQQRLWFLDRLEGTSTEYNIASALHLKGELDAVALERALETIVERHESLRTHFEEVDGEPVQVIDPEYRLALPLEDLSGWEESARQERVQKVLRSEAGRPFDLKRGPVLRVKLLRLGAQDHIFVRTTHHIVSDGWSEGVFSRELMVLYEAYREGRENPLQPLGVQYADFALWQRKWLDGGGLESGLSYWKKQLCNIPSRLELPTDRPRPAVQTFDAEACSVTLSAAQAAALKRLSRDSQSTLYMTLLSVFAMLLSRYSGQDDIVVGSPIANRQDEQLEGLIGFFVNFLVMRVRPHAEMSFRELLEQVRQTALEAYRYQDVPFERLVEELSPERSLNTTPVFQVTFALQNAPMGAPELRQLEIEPVGGGELRVRFDLEVHAVEQRGGEIALHWVYNRDLFDRWRMEQMARHYVQMLEAVVKNAECAVGRVEMLSAAERRRLLYEWNDTKAEYPADQCVHELFEAQVGKTPDAAAVVFEDQELSYAELNARANRLAHYLRELGVKPDDRVAICVERSFEMIIGLLGVLKAGGAYVPLDPAYPVERLRFMLEDSAPVALLTQADLLNLFENLPLPVVELDDRNAAWRNQPDLNPDPHLIGLSSSHLAYVIYTSGSTGQPKGVAIEHRAVVNRLLWMHRTYELDMCDAVLQKTPFGFDVSVWEFFWPLLTGARLVMARPEGHRDTAYLVAAIAQNNITTMHFVPSMLQMFLEHAGLDDISTLIRVVCSGEALSTVQLRRFQERIPKATLHNLYGPTEAAVDVTAWTCPIEFHQSFVPIGRPIANTRIYILDGHGEPVPVGVSGELYIAGVQVARGYLNRPELTAERFLADPFVDEPGARMYRTGDLGRYLADGNIEFLGRNDFQVKIRGFRIELGEIESRLMEHSDVREAVVVAREDAGSDKSLVAYFTSGKEKAVDAEALRTYLSAALPEYMVPAAYVWLESLPLTANGKLDRKALPAPEQDAYAAQEYEPPLGEVEEKLAGIWADVLDLDRVGRRDNFFSLGGHSMLTTQVINRIQLTLKVELSIRTLLEAPTVARLAEQIDNSICLRQIEVLLPIRSQGTLKPIFFMPPGSGLSQCFIGFLKYLDRERPIYGLQSRSFTSSPASVQTIEEIAVDYHNEIRTIQPTGPYHLAGWSIGGYLAFAVANVIQRLGDDVALLSLIDSMRFPLGEAENIDARTSLNLLDYAYDLFGEELRSQHPTLRALYDRLREDNRLPPFLNENHFSILLQNMRDAKTQQQKFVPMKYLGDLLIFVATKNEIEIQSVLREWQPYITGTIRHHLIACTHRQMMDPIPLAEIASLLESELKNL